MRKQAFSAPLLVLLSGVFWGSMGLFVRRFTALGFDSIQITSARLTLAAAFFWIILLLRSPAERRIAVKDIPLFLGLGLGSILFFTVCYFSAMTRMSLSAAAILLYTSPIWVMLLSVLLFKEKLTGRKLAALMLAFGGCVLVSGLSGGGVTAAGLLLGLGAGLGYGLYSILGTIALRRYSPYTVTAYTFLVAAVGSWFICRPAAFFAVLSAAPSPIGTALLFALTALVTAVIPFLAYTQGLRGMEAGKAAILATVEPLVATLLGVAVFREPLTPLSALGILLILSAVVILNVKTKEPKKSAE